MSNVKQCAGVLAYSKVVSGKLSVMQTGTHFFLVSRKVLRKLEMSEGRIRQGYCTHEPAMYNSSYWTETSTYSTFSPEEYFPFPLFPLRLLSLLFPAVGSHISRVYQRLPFPPFPPFSLSHGAKKRRESR